MLGVGRDPASGVDHAGAVLEVWWGELRKEKAKLAARWGVGEFLQRFTQPPKAEWSFNRWGRLGLLGGR